MPGPVIAAIQAQKARREPADAFSLALIATGTMDTPLVGTIAIWSSYVDDHRYTACHDIAATLVDILQPVPGTAPTATGVGAAAPGVAHNNIGNGRFLKFDFGRHSFTLVNSAGVVECIEGWAGTPPLTVGQCLFHRANEIMVTVPTAQTAFGRLLSPMEATRRAGVDAISRAGLGGFGPVNAVPALTVSAYPLAPTATIAARYRARVNIALEWACGARQHHRGRFTCSVCLTYHGWTRSWLGNTWGRCGGAACGRIYCPTCKADLNPFVFDGTTTRLCTCNQAITEIPWGQVG
jgi:hypothetical protein